MLKLVLQETEDAPPVSIKLEHSLLSVSKWEQHHEKLFFGKEPKTAEEMESYIYNMVQGENAPEGFVDKLTSEHFQQIADYMVGKQSGTILPEEKGQTKGPQETLSSELIYYWLVQFRIPFHPTETWHLHRTMNLIRICGIKQSKPKPKSQQETLAEYRRLNDQRLAELGTSG